MQWCVLVLLQIRNTYLAEQNLDGPSVCIQTRTGPYVRHNITSLLGANKGDEFLVNQVRSFPLRDVSRLGDSDES